MNKNNTNLIRRIPELVDLPGHILDDLADVSSVARYSKNDVFQEEGERCPGVFYILRGLVRGYQVLGNREESIWALFREGEFFTCPHAVNNGSNHNNPNHFQALEETELLVVPREDYERLTEKYTPLRIRGFQLINQLLLRRMEEKSHLLNMNASERYLYFLENYSELIMRVPLGHISTFLGIRQSSLSRIRRQISEGRMSVAKN